MKCTIVTHEGKLMGRVTEGRRLGYYPLFHYQFDELKKFKDTGIELDAEILVECHEPSPGVYCEYCQDDPAHCKGINHLKIEIPNPSTRSEKTYTKAEVEAIQENAFRQAFVWARGANFTSSTHDAVTEYYEDYQKQNPL